MEWVKQRKVTVLVNTSLPLSTVQATSSRLAGCRILIGACGLRTLAWMLMVFTWQGCKRCNCHIGTVFMHGMLDYLQRQSKAPAPAP
eukprot:1158597-Pelagomonas_calceolata.AAC.1